jgi:RsiW-degrading membrane proteinase PrsW (M82 family)
MFDIFVSFHFLFSIFAQTIKNNAKQQKEELLLFCSKSKTERHSIISETKNHKKVFLSVFLSSVHSYGFLALTN